MTAASVVTILFCCRLKHLPLNMKAEALLRVSLKYMLMCRQTQLITSLFDEDIYYMSAALLLVNWQAISLGACN